MSPVPEFLARRRRTHILVAAALILGIVAFELVGDDEKADTNLVPVGPAAPGAGSGPVPARARELGLAAKLPAPLPGTDGAVHFVSPSGDDSAPGTSEQPWATVQKALDALNPGESAVIRGGTYVEDLVMRRAGTADAPMVLSAQEGETVVLRPASEEGDTYAVRFSDAAAYVRLQGFVIEGATGTSSTNVYFEDEVHDIELSGNEIRFSQDQGVFSERTTSDLAIVGNRIHDNGRGHESGQHQSHGMYIEGRGHLIANNVVYDHPEGFGIQLYPDAANVTVVNNTVVRSGHSGIVIGGSDGVEAVTVRNNIFASNADFGIAMDDDCPSDTVVDTNVVHGNRGGGVEGGCAGVDTSRQNFSADPMFSGPAANDFTIGAESPAADRARAPWAPLTDVRGRPRPSGPAADIGAYEGT